MNRVRRRYMYHLDNIRRKKNIAIKTLCDGICSDRQYRKYQNGTNNISDIRLLQFCEKLGISSRDFYFTLNEKDEYDFKKIRDTYNSLIAKKYSRTKKLLETNYNFMYLTVQNQRLLDYCKIRYRYSLKESTLEHTVNEINKFIDIDNCCKNEIFDFVDILFLLLLSEIEVIIGRTKSLDVLLNILSNPDVLYVSPEKRDLIAPVFSNISIMLGRLKRLDELLIINKLGIDYCIKNSFSRSLTKLYYTRAYALKLLKRHIESQTFIARCISNSISIESNKEITKMHQILKKDFDISPFDILKEHFDRIKEEINQ